MDNTKNTATCFAYRIATIEDISVLREIMHASISVLQNTFLTQEQVEASFEVMGIDTQLIEDKTYYAILEGEEIIGCGGWSRRSTLYGGNHTKGRDDTKLNPMKDAARVRAMYTHPDHTRRGIGRYIIKLCETKAAEEGFSRYELMATLAGQPLYQSCGYEIVHYEDAVTSNGIKVPLVMMQKHG